MTKLKGIFPLLCALGLALVLPARAGIVYSNGPLFPVPSDTSAKTLNFVGADFGFAAEPNPWNTHDPRSNAYLEGPINFIYYIAALSTNEVLCQDTQAVVVPEGTSIGYYVGNFTNDGEFSEFIPLGSWSNSASATFAIFTNNGYININGTNSTLGWSGPLSTNGEGYLAVGFYARDGLHYGWIHVALPSKVPGLMGQAIVPFVLDWAYETVPGNSILAGQTSEDVFYEANLTGANEIPANNSTNSGSGQFTLTDYADGWELAYNVNLNFSTPDQALSFKPEQAGIFGPTSPFQNSKHLVAELGVCTLVTNSYFYPFGPIYSDNTASIAIPYLPAYSLSCSGQVPLSTWQAEQFRAGQLYVNIPSTNYPQGELRGQISLRAIHQFTAILGGPKEFLANPRHHRAEAAFVLGNGTLSWQVAVDTNFAWTSMGIFRFPSAWMSPFNFVANLNPSNEFVSFQDSVPTGSAINGDQPGIVIVGTAIPVPVNLGFSGQTNYFGGLTLTDQQICQLQNGQFYLVISSRMFPAGEISGRIEPSRNPALIEFPNQPYAPPFPPPTSLSNVTITNSLPIIEPIAGTDLGSGPITNPVTLITNQPVTIQPVQIMDSAGGVIMMEPSRITTLRLPLTDPPVPPAGLNPDQSTQP